MEAPMTDKEINEQFTAKVRRGIFKPVARHLTNVASAEDRLQDAIAQTWLMYRRYIVEKNKVLDDAILVHSCRQRAVDLDRNFVPAAGTHRRRDVLHPRNYRDSKVEVLRLEGVAEDGSPEGDRPLQLGYADQLTHNPSRNIRSAIDLRAWVGRLNHRDRALMTLTMAGHELTRAAHLLDMPYPHVYRRQKQLGRELAHRAGVRILASKGSRQNPPGKMHRRVRSHCLDAQPGRHLPQGGSQ
jgi:hypothetical protein